MASIKKNSLSSNQPKKMPPQMCNFKKFPYKLWNLLGECNDGAIGWSEDGAKIHIHKEEFITSPTVQKYFAAKLRSFIRQLNLYGFHKISHYNHPEEYQTFGSCKCLCSHNVPFMVYQRDGFHRYMHPANLSKIVRRSSKAVVDQENMEDTDDADEVDQVYPHSNIEKLEMNWVGQSGNALYMNSLKAAETSFFIDNNKNLYEEEMDLTEDGVDAYCSVMDFNSMQISADSNMDVEYISDAEEFVEIQVVESLYNVDGTEEVQVEFIYVNEFGNVNLNENNNGQNLN